MELQVNVEKLLQHTSLERMLQFHVWGWEILNSKKFPACREKTKTYIHQNLVIIDLLGFSMAHINSNTRSFVKVNRCPTSAPIILSYAPSPDSHSF